MTNNTKCVRIICRIDGNFDSAEFQSVTLVMSSLCVACCIVYVYSSVAESSHLSSSALLPTKVASAASVLDATITASAME